MIGFEIHGMDQNIKIVRHKNIMEVSNFRGHKTFKIGFVTLDLTLGPIRAAHPFQVIDSQTSYHMLLRRPWIHYNKSMPLTYHKCLKAIWKGKRVHINAIGSPFQRDETHFLEATYCDELAEWWSHSFPTSRNPLSKWEDLDGGKPRVDNSAFTSTGRPRKWK